MKNPIRPADQFRTLQHPISVVPEICLAYKPRKTYLESKRMALPVVYPEHKDYFLNPPIASQYLFPAEDGSCLFPDDAHPHYAALIGKMCRKAGIPEIPWYQLRHIATAWCISKGMSGPEIAMITGWSNSEMVMHYNSNNIQLIYYFRSINKDERFEKKLGSL
jgi:integrase